MANAEKQLSLRNVLKAYVSRRSCSRGQKLFGIIIGTRQIESWSVHGGITIEELSTSPSLVPGIRSSLRRGGIILIKAVFDESHIV